MSGVTRMGIAPEFLTSEAKVARLVRYWAGETPEVSFWSLWPNFVTVSFDISLEFLKEARMVTWIVT